jgi:hypothetical protein
MTVCHVRRQRTSSDTASTTETHRDRRRRQKYHGQERNTLHSGRVSLGLAGNLSLHEAVQLSAMLSITVDQCKIAGSLDLLLASTDSYDSASGHDG